MIQHVHLLALMHMLRSLRRRCGSSRLKSETMTGKGGFRYAT